MKQVFQIEIFTHDDERALTRSHIGAALVNGMRDCFKREISVIGAEEIIVEQNCGTPENTSENSKKPLRLSGNIAWENKIENGDDYLEDRFNELLDR